MSNNFSPIKVQDADLLSIMGNGIIYRQQYMILHHFMTFLALKIMICASYATSYPFESLQKDNHSKPIILWHLLSWK